MYAALPFISLYNRGLSRRSPPMHNLRRGEKTGAAIGLYPKGQFSKNTVYLERGMPYFAFVATNAVIVRKIDKP